MGLQLVIILSILLFIVGSYVVIEKSIVDGTSKTIGFGWLFSIIGVIGTIISYVLYSDAKELFLVAEKKYDNERVFAQYYGGDYFQFYWDAKENMENPQFAMYAYIAFAVIGIILLIIGYKSKISDKKKIIIEPTPSDDNTEDNVSAVIKIKELKELLDSDLITQEEFDAKRKDLLDKM